MIFFKEVCISIYLKTDHIGTNCNLMLALCFQKDLKNQPLGSAENGSKLKNITKKKKKTFKVDIKCL